MRISRNPLAVLLPSLALLVSSVSLTVRADYASTVNALSPVAYWRFDEAASSPPLNEVTNASTLGSVLNGTVVEDATRGQAGVVGNSLRTINVGNVVGYCGGKVRVPFNHALNPSGPFSVEFWVKANSLGTDGTGFAVFNSLMGEFAASARVGYLMYINNAGQYEFRLGNSGGYVGTVNNTANPPHAGAPGYPAQVGVWRHVVCIFDGTRTRIMVNGTNVATRTLTGPQIASLQQNTQTPLQIPGTAFTGTESDGPAISATGSSGNRGFDGWVDEFAVYNYALTTNQCAAHYEAATTNSSGYTAQILADNPVGYWPFNETAYVPGASTTAANSGSAGNVADGTLGRGTLNGQSGPGYNGLGAGNKAVRFDGDNGYMYLPNPPALSNLSGQVTMMAWVKPNQKNFYRDIIARGWDGVNTGNSYAETFLRISRGGANGGYGNTNYYEVGSYDGGPSYYSALSRMPEGDIGNWVFLAGTYDGSTWRLYRNGQQVSSVASPFGAVLITNRWCVGARSDANENPYEGLYYSGLMDEPAIFGTALSGADILNIYNASEASPVITRPVSTPNGFAHATWPNQFQGRSATLSVWAEGPGTLGYQWYSNGIPLGVTTTNLNLVGMVAATPTYSVVVTNAYGSATSSVTLNITHSTPVVTVQPGSYYRFAGLPFTFSTTVGGSTPLAFMWRTNGVLIPGNLSSGTDIGNTTFASFSDTASLSSPTGYSCFITNIVGNTTTASGTLTVLPTGFSTQYCSVVLSDNPIAYWRLGETSGAVAFDYIGTNNGTYFNAVLNQPGLGDIPAETGPPATNKCPSFGALNRYVGLISGTGINFEGTNASFSIECWVKGAPGQPDESTIVAKGTGAGGTTANEQFALDISGGNYRLFTRFAGDFYDARASVGPDGNWQHVVGVYDQSNPADPKVYIYVDGELVGSGNGNPPTQGGLRASTHPVSIGSKRLGNAPDYDGFFNGLIDEVAIYNTALSAGDVFAHFSAAQFGPPVITSQPTSQTNYVGLPVTLSVSVAGSRPISYEWYMGTPPGGTLVGSSRTYAIDGLVPTDEGNYYVKVLNSEGSTNSVTVYIDVLPGPTSPPSIPGLVMLHQFEDNLTDATGRGNNGTAMHVTATSTNTETGTFTSGRVGAKAFKYSTDAGPYGVGVPAPSTTPRGTNNHYATLGIRPDLQFSSNVNFTVSFWIKLPIGFLGGDLPFFGNVIDSLGNPGYCFAPAYGFGTASGDPDPDPLNYGGWAYAVYNPTAADGIRVYGALGSINDGEWHHLAYVFNRGSDGVVYLDGKPAASERIAGSSAVNAGNLSANRPANIGQDPTGSYGETGEGEMDELAVWTRALSRLEVASVFLSGLSNMSPAYVQHPVILTQPVNILAVSGTATNLSVVVSTSTGATNYQWYRNGVLLSGQTSATLNIASLSSANTGSYFVRVGDGGGYTDSAIVTVSMATQPLLTTALSGATLTLTHPSQSGIQYVVEWKGALTNGVWNSLVTNTGTGSPINVPTSTSPDALRFYRIRMMNP